MVLWVHKALTIKNNDLNNVNSTDDDENMLHDRNTDEHTSLHRVKIVATERSSVFSNILIDTGSFASLINSQYVQKLGLRSYPLQSGDIKQIFVANSRSVPITSKVRIHLQIGGLNSFEWAYVVKSLSHNVILGLRFLRSNGVHLLHDRGVAKIRGV